MTVLYDVEILIRLDRLRLGASLWRGYFLQDIRLGIRRPNRGQLIFTLAQFFSFRTLTDSHRFLRLFLLTGSTLFGGDAGICV